MAREIPPELKAFDFHGVELTWTSSSKEATGDCPFCSKEGHFYVNKDTGQFNCHVCDENGNARSFLTKLIEYSLRMTTIADLEPLSELRDIPVDVLKDFNVCRSIIDDCILIPAYNSKKKIANIYRCFLDHEAKWKAYPTAGCKVHPIGIHLLQKKQVTRWICEGPWDGMALYGVFKSLELRGDRLVRTTNSKKSLLANHGVIAVPGSGSFDPSWFEYLDGLQTHLVYDNDHPRKNPKTGKITQPGWDGMQRVAKLAGENGQHPSSLYQLRWGNSTKWKRSGYDETLDNGYDIRDLIADQGPLKALKTVNDKLEQVEIIQTIPDEDTNDQPQIEPLHRSSFNELCKDFESCLHFTQILKDTLATMLAVVISTELQGEQLWLRVIGPPGSGKTTLAECITAARDYVFPQSIFTGFHSGFIGKPKKGEKADPSLLPDMDGKTFIVKDGDTLLTAPNLPRLLSELRDIYDGTSRSRYRTRASKQYEGLRISMIICGTDQIRLLNRSSLGERFLDCEILGNEDTQPFLDRALSNAYATIVKSLLPENKDNEVKSDDQLLILKQVTLGFIIYLKDNLHTLPVPTLSESMGNRIKALGQIVSFMRATVHREKDGLVQRPRVELATRLVGQLTKLAICLALVKGKKTIDREIYNITRKRAFDTAEGFQLEVASLLIKYQDGLSSKQIALELNLSESSVKRYLIDMQELQIVNRCDVPNRSGIRGRDRHIWKLSAAIRVLWKQTVIRG